MKKAVIMLLVMALAAATLAFAGCGGSGSSDTPEQVVEQFLSASMEENADAAYELISEDSKSELDDKESLVAGFSDGIDAYEVGAATISGDEARVAIVFQLSGLEGDLEFDIVLVKENGAWKIALADTNLEAEKAIEELMQQLQPTQ